MSLDNSCRFVGRLGADPDMQYTPSGLAIVKVGLAVNDRRKINEEWVTETVWVNLTAFGRQAETMQQIASKGDTLVVDTRYSKSSYQNEQDETRYRHDFIVSEWKLAGRPSGASAEESSEDEAFEPDETEDHLPF